MEGVVSYLHFFFAKYKLEGPTYDPKIVLQHNNTSVVHPRLEILLIVWKQNKTKTHLVNGAREDNNPSRLPIFSVLASCYSLNVDTTFGSKQKSTCYYLGKVIWETAVCQTCSSLRWTFNQTLKVCLALAQQVNKMRLSFLVLSKFRFFTVEVIREMDNNVRLDKGYLSVSESRGQSEASL